MRKNVYFLSDAHLGSLAIPHARMQERRLVRFLDSIKEKAAAVYLLGDMFDFWNEYKYVVPKGYTRFLGKLSELTDMGVIIQTNVSSFEKFFRRNRILKLIDRGLIHILGTDAHSLNRGNPDLYLQACGFIRKKCGEERLVQMQKTAEEIFYSAL